MNRFTITQASIEIRTGISSTLCSASAWCAVVLLMLTSFVLSAAPTPAPDAIPAAKHKQKVIFWAPTETLDEFRALAQRAAELGATHVVISDLPKSRWQWDIDLNDPYPNWGMKASSIFKVIVPPELAAWLPADYAKHNLEIIKERAAVLKEFNLKAVFEGIEPGWLPEGVYRAHPDWRGPRCEHPVRARHTYYAICVDQPEVLAMYRRAVAELCKVAPIEVFDLLTNDSGGGFCWSTSLYPGANGPTWCEHRTPAERVTGFMSAIQAGAADAGLKSDVSIQYGSGYIAETEVDSIIASLQPGQTLNGHDRNRAVPLLRIGGWSDQLYPILGIPYLETLAEQLEQTQRNPGADVMIILQRVESPWTYELLRRYRTQKVRGLAARFALLRSIAADYADESEADNLVEMIHRINLAVDTLCYIGLEPILGRGVVNQRWVTRPFVPFPLELKSEERDYYRRFQFQANSEAEAANLMNIQGYMPYQGYSGALLATLSLNAVIDGLTASANLCSEAASNLSDQAKAGELRALQARLHASTCFLKTARNAIQYQAILDRTDYSATVQQSTIYPWDGDQRLRELQTITRNEIDNANDLAALLESSKVPLLQLAETPETEDIFLLSPDLAAQLHKKVRIMLEHQLDANRLYQRRQG